MTKTEAKSRLTNYLSLNTNIAKADMTFNLLMNEFKKFYISQIGQNIKQKTYDLFLINSIKMTNFFDGMLVKKIEFNNIEAFKLLLRDKNKLANRSINIILTDLNKVFNYALERKWIANIPTIKRVSENKKTKR